MKLEPVRSAGYDDNIIVGIEHQVDRNLQNAIGNSFVAA